MNKTETKEIMESFTSWVEYNKHDLGEFGDFIRTEYAYKGLEMILNDQYKSTPKSK